MSHGMEAFIAEVEEKTGDDSRVRFFMPGFWAHDPTRSNNFVLVFWISQSSASGRWARPCQRPTAVSLSFIFKSVPQMYELMDAAPAEALGKALEENGIVALGYYDAGAWPFYNSIKPIDTPQMSKV